MRGVKKRTVIGRLGIAAACSSIWWECWDGDEDEDDALWRTRESVFRRGEVGNDRSARLKGSRGDTWEQKARMPPVM